MEDSLEERRKVVKLVIPQSCKHHQFFKLVGRNIRLIVAAVLDELYGCCDIDGVEAPLFPCERLEIADRLKCLIGILSHHLDGSGKRLEEIDRHVKRDFTVHEG